MRFSGVESLRWRLDETASPLFRASDSCHLGAPENDPFQAQAKRLIA